MTLTFIGVNILIAFLVFFVPDLESTFRFSVRAPSPIHAFLCMFFHQNVMHLLGNMIFLAAVGPLVEFAVGRWKFLTIYIVGGLIGVLGHWILMSSTNADQPLVGASGAIAACVGYCTIRFMGVKVPLLPNLGIPVGVVAVIWIGLQALGGFVRLGDANSGGIAFWAHLAGFLGGVLLALILKAPEQSSLHLGHAVLDQMNDRSPAASLAAAEIHLKRHPGDRRALRSKADALHSLHDHESEQGVWIQLLEDCPEMDVPECIKKLNECGGLRKIPIAQRLKLADSLAEHFAPVAELILADAATDPASESCRADVLLSLATVVQKRDEIEARSIAQQLTAKFALDPAVEIAKQRGLLP